MIATVTTNNGSTTLTTGGKRIRILAVLIPVNPIQGDQVTVDFRQGISGTPLARATSNPIPPNVANVDAGIGLSNSVAMPDQTVVATGVIVYNAVGTGFMMPLPDIWWDFDITVTIAGTGAISEAQVTYERV